MSEIVDALFNSVSARLAQNFLENAEEVHQNRAAREQAEKLQKRRLAVTRSPSEIISLDI